MDYQKTGELIAASRKEKGLTQKQLAELLNISDRTVSKWERGVGFPDISLIEPLSDALELSIVALIRGEENRAEEEATIQETVRVLSREYGKQLTSWREKTLFTVSMLPFIAFLIVCGISAAYYWEVGRWKAIVAYFGLAEALIVFIAFVCLLILACSKIKKYVLMKIVTWLQILLTVMQIPPMLGGFALGYSYSVNGIIHAILLVVGAAVVLALRKGREYGTAEYVFTQ